MYHYCLALLGAVFYGFPSRKLFVIGVTGTKGKSTTIELMNVIFEAAGKKTAFINSVRRKIGGESIKNPGSMTMPGRFYLQKFLRNAIRAGCTHAFIEVTSQGVVQHRHRFIDFNAAVFLNIRPEHIESHGSFENYLEAKKNFFRSVRRSSAAAATFFINRDDEHAQDFESVAGGRVIFFDKDTLFHGVLDGDIKKSGSWISRAEFLQENAAAAVAVAELAEIPRSIILEALVGFEGVPGRLEYITREPFSVVVDYAHTPDSLEAVYASLEQRGRLMCVLGAAGGGRDKWKRPEMGRVADAHCDHIILTDEDPYDERPDAIIQEIAVGIKNREPERIIDRAEAIRSALRRARAGDAVIITGKGSEQCMHLERGRKIPWSDRDVVEQFLRES